LALFAFAVVVMVLFLVVNRQAYKGFFTNDYFDNMANARRSTLSYYVRLLIQVQPRGQDDFPSGRFLVLLRDGAPCGFS